MSISTYAELKTAVANWLNRSDLTIHIPDFISLAEVRINRDVAKMNVVGLERRATASTVAGDAFLATPSRILAVRSLKINSDPVRVLQYLPQDVLNQRYTRVTNEKPFAYTVIGDEIKLAPTPDAVYTVEMSYCAKEQALSNSNTTNWFTANAPDLLLYGSLIEAEPFLKNDERIQTWSSMYTSAINALEDMNRALSFSGGNIRMRVV